MMSKPAQSLAGRLLLALPGMPDPRFARSVNAICVHDANGALGIGVGAELAQVTLHRLLDDLSIGRGSAPDAPVLHGGPVEPQRGFVLHSADWVGQGTLLVGPQDDPLWALTASREVLVAISEARGPARWLVALGYAGWAPGQLDEEMQRHGWHAAAGRAEVLFETPAGARWAASWRAEGVDPSLLAGVTGRA